MEKPGKDIRYWFMLLFSRVGQQEAKGIVSLVRFLYAMIDRIFRLISPPGREKAVSEFPLNLFYQV